MPLQVGADWVQRGDVVTVSEVLTGFGRRGDRDLRRCWRASGSELPENTEVVISGCSPTAGCRLLRPGLADASRRDDPASTRGSRSATAELVGIFRQLRLESHWQPSDQGFLGGDIFGAPESVSTGGSAS